MVDSDKRWILERSQAELADEFQELGLKKFNARQVFQWIYHQLNPDPAQWTNLAKQSRALIDARYDLQPRPILKTLRDPDGTQKFLIGLADGLQVESVLIREKSHFTFCLSSQVGCPLGCRFCATGSMGFRRNLSCGEIVSQVLTLKQALPDPRAAVNLVFMGMGEPLLNYDNLKRALVIILDADGFNISARHVTVSTAGLLEPLQKLEREFPLVKIAFSLNAASPELRRELMPVSGRESLPAILDHFRRHPRKYRITCEYVLLKGINDSLVEARKLVRLLHAIPAKINLIPYNRNLANDFQPPADPDVKKFQEYLMAHGLTAVIRHSKGQASRSACGQLTIPA